MKNQSIFASIGLLLISASLIVSCEKPKVVVTPEPVVTSSPVTSTPTTDSKSVRVGYNVWPGSMPWHITEKANLFKSDKAKFVPVWYDEYLKSIGDLVAGKLDSNVQALMDTVLSVVEGYDQVVVLVVDNSTGSDKIIAKAGINSAADLKGKTVSTEKGTVDHYLLLLALKKAGLSEKDVTMKFMDTEKAAAAFAASEVDATAVFTPYSNNALKRAGSKEIASSKDFPGAISDVVSFRREFVEKNPEAVQAAVDSWFDTLAYIKANQAKSDELMAKQSKSSVAEYVESGKGLKIFTVAENLQAFKAGKDRTSIAFSAEELKKVITDLGMTKKTADLSKMFDDRFVKAYAAKHKK
jgi:NitT/TauT family transport system substrate-binding protein